MGRAQGTAEALLERRRPSDTLTLYRCGSLRKARRYPEQASLYELADSLRPAGRAGRLEGLFCATAAEIQWWANEQNVTWQLDVAGEVWAYPLDEWTEIYYHWQRLRRQGHDNDDQTLARRIECWWQSGVPLAAGSDRDLARYEALVLPEQIAGRRRLGIGRRALHRHQLPYEDAHPTWHPEFDRR